MTFDRHCKPRPSPPARIRHHLRPDASGVSGAIGQGRLSAAALHCSIIDGVQAPPASSSGPERCVMPFDRHCIPHPSLPTRFRHPLRPVVSGAAGDIGQGRRSAVVLHCPIIDGVQAPPASSSGPERCVMPFDRPLIVVLAAAAIPPANACRRSARALRDAGRRGRHRHAARACSGAGRDGEPRHDG